MIRALLIGALVVAYFAVQENQAPSDIVIPKTGLLADIHAAMKNKPDAKQYANFFKAWAHAIEREASLRTVSHVRSALRVSIKSAVSAGYITSHGIGPQCDGYIVSKVGLDDVELNEHLRASLAEAFRHLAAACGG